MLSSLAEAIRAAGGRVDIDRSTGGADVVRVQMDGLLREFVVHVRERAPYVGELPALAACHEQLSRRHRALPLLMAKFVSSTTGRHLSNAGWSWADAAGNCELRAEGLRISRRIAERPTAVPRSLPTGSGSLRVLRAVFGCLARAEWSTGDLAVASGRSPVTVIQTMRKLEKLGLASHPARASWRVDGPALLDRFLAEYPGPGGNERYFYTAEELGLAASKLSHAYRTSVAISADVGPDLVAPRRVPSKLIVYTQPTVDASATLHDAVAVDSLGEANIVQIFPTDETVFPLTSLLFPFRDRGDLQLADPTQMIWDLERLGGEDREAAAYEMRRWLMTRR